MKHITIFLVGIIISSSIFAQQSYEAKADSIIRLMTLDEKIGQLNQITGFQIATGPITNSGDKRKLIKEGKIGSMLNVCGEKATRSMQELAMQSRLRIPLLFGLDVIHGYRTVFPIPLAMASSFDTEAIRKSCRVAARESIVSGIHWTFSPMLDVARDPRWGRVMEGPGEDTYWACEMGKAMINGYQQPFDDGLRLMACAKHFAAYGAAIGGRDYNTVDISMQTLHNVYLPPFKVAAKNGVASFMCSFNEINGVPSSGNAYLYDLLYKQWGYKGLVVSDWASIWEMVVHGYSKDKEMAAMQAIQAGVTIDMESNIYSSQLKKLVETGKVSEATLNDAVRKVLVQKYQLGLFDDPYRYCNSQKETNEILTDSHRKVAYEMACKSIILLKNDSLLPVKIPQRVAVVGPLANFQRAMDGNWTVAAETNVAVTLLEALKNKFPQAEINFIEGCSISDNNKSGFPAAIKSAQEADLVILALGENWGMSGEARSRGDLHIPGIQEELACEIYKVNKNCITLLMGGRPLIFNQIAEKAPAILYTWFLGTEAGNAMTDIITGKYNPSARVPMSFPKHIGQIPVYYNYKNTGRPAVDKEGNYSSRYIDIDYKPQYPFGYGLSYTTFEYGQPNITIDKDSISINIPIHNSGLMDGHELIQIYTRKWWGESTRPVKELKAVNNVFLKKGEKRMIHLKIPLERLAYYGQSGWEKANGDYTIMLGRNAEDIIFKKNIKVNL